MQHGKVIIMHIQMVSLDLMIALPILSVALLLAFGYFRTQDAYLAAYGKDQNAYLRLCYDSQAIVLLLYSAQANYTEALSIISGSSGAYGADATLGSPADGCQDGGVCRIVLIGQKPYLLQVKP